MTATEVVKADARNRAWRTFVQNIQVDLAITLGPILVDAVTNWDGAFTGSYWQAVGTTAGKTVVLVLLAYWMRLRKPPAAPPA